MKHLLFSILLLPLSGLAQETDENVPEIPMEDGEIVYKEVVNLPTISVEEIKERASYFFKQADNAEVDKEQGENSIKGSASIDFIAGKKQLKVKMEFDLIIEFKEGRYRVICENIKYTPYPTDQIPHPQTIKAEKLYDEYKVNKNKKSAGYQLQYLQNTDKLIKEQIEAVKEIMSKSVPQETDDW